MDYIPALSLSRPWTELILFAGKTVENRVWPTNYRGPVILHTAQSEDWTRAYQFVERFRGANGQLPRAITQAFAMPHQNGYAGVAVLTDDHHQSNPTCTCEWGMEDQWHKTLADAKPFNFPILGPGGQTLFRPPPEVDAAARALLQGQNYKFQLPPSADERMMLF